MSKKHDSLGTPPDRRMNMPEAYLIDAVRTPVGRRNGGLSTIHSADLGAHVLKGLMDRTGIEPGAVEDVIFGCCDTIGSQAGDIARTCWLAAGLPGSCGPQRPCCPVPVRDPKAP